jgi:hypothetical protein
VRTRPRQLRFRLRTLLASVAVVAVLLWFVQAYVLSFLQEQRQIVTVRQLRSQVYTEPQGQYLFRQFAGDALSQRAVYVHLDDPRVTDDWLENLRDLKHIEVLSIKSANVTDAGLKHLLGLRNLRDLNLVNTQVSESGVTELRDALPGLKLVQSRTSRP